MCTSAHFDMRGSVNSSESSISGSFANDILIAASARELGAIILTENSDDFIIIASVVDIRFVKPEETFWKSTTVAPQGEAES
jgi:hypothetical protein